MKDHFFANTSVSLTNSFTSPVDACYLTGKDTPYQDLILIYLILYISNDSDEIRRHIRVDGDLFHLWVDNQRNTIILITEFFYHTSERSKTNKQHEAPNLRDGQVGKLS